MHSKLDFSQTKIIEYALRNFKDAKN